MRRLPSSPCWLATELAAEQAAGQRAPDHQAQPFAGQHRHDLAFQVAPGHRVVGLQRFEARQAQPLGDAQRLDDLPGRPVGDADVAHVALAHQLVERAHGLLDRRGRVEAVDLVQVDVLELQPLQAGLDAVEDVAARRAARVRPRAGVAEDLGGDDHAVARHLQVLQRLAGDLLRHAARVHVGGVDEVDAGVDRLADQALGIGLLQVADLAQMPVLPPKVMVPRHSSRDEQAGAAEGFVAHGQDLQFRRLVCTGDRAGDRCR